MKTTPFHPRLSELNQTGLYGHWSGYLSALRYDLAAKHEYFAVRNSAGFFDTSPLYKYRITGPDAERFLAGLMTRDVRRCRPGQAMYTVWCDDAGYVLEDGVVFRHADDDWLLTAADPNLGYLDSLVGRLRVSIEDVSEDYGMLAVQGPRSREILATLAPEVKDLAFFGLTPAKMGGAPVTISRTGYTGDLGFEVRVEADDALGVLDKIIQAGEGQGLRPFGEDALMMLRIEAGLSLINVEFNSARYAFTDAERFTPKELGFGWMLGRDGAALGDDRPFIGRRAIERELRDGTSRWATVGLWVDWEAHRDLHLEHGLVVPKDETPVPWESMLYGGPDRDQRVGYATSLMYSPVLQRHIAIARVLPEYAARSSTGLGSTVHLEITVDHEYLSVPATTDRLPLYNPARKTSGTAREPAPISHRMEQS
ncbi:aminomethyltransferase family protein [Nocardioides sp.]|uniref:aminomethyltransferase family protein n=1 Tax=Nocardioides sp. TaxID=35761 RepID=UPI002F413540